MRLADLAKGLFLLVCAGLMLWAGSSQVQDDGFGPVALADAKDGQALLIIVAIPIAIVGIGELVQFFSRSHEKEPQFYCD